MVVKALCRTSWMNLRQIGKKIVHHRCTSTIRFACDFICSREDQAAETLTQAEGESGEDLSASQDLSAEQVYNADGRTMGNQQGERVPGKDKVDWPLKW